MAIGQAGRAAELAEGTACLGRRRWPVASVFDKFGKRLGVALGVEEADTEKGLQPFAMNQDIAVRRDERPTLAFMGRVNVQSVTSIGGTDDLQYLR